MAVQFGENLRLCRERAGLSREKLGTLASVGRGRVGKLERGVHEPQLETTLKLADALSIPLGDLLRGIDWTPACRGAFEFQFSAESRGATTDCANALKRHAPTVERLALERRLLCILSS